MAIVAELAAELAAEVAAAVAVDVAGTVVIASAVVIALIACSGGCLVPRDIIQTSTRYCELLSSTFPVMSTQVTVMLLDTTMAQLNILFLQEHTPLHSAKPEQNIITQT